MPRTPTLGASLFSATTRPLADRMRPQTLAEFAGQRHILAPGMLLRRAIEADRLSSLIFYGPPGTGKTTLARIIANTTSAHFTAINAVLDGIKDLRQAIADATHRQQAGQPTILFVDEVHRFNKAQQDALLPAVERGTVTLIGATTENPHFEVNRALVSRSRLFRLEPLKSSDLRLVVWQALTDPRRGYGARKTHLDEEALEHLVDVANGDARALLNALELAIETTPPGPDGTIRISLKIAEDSIQQRALLYDKGGDEHFNTISAFIKSIRGSDPDAALYWLAKMVHAGEAPRYIFRRLLILASEDVGLAAPEAIGVVNSCAQAFDRIGMPEGQYLLAHATLFLATLPKSNSIKGFFAALKAVSSEHPGEVPGHLKDSSRDLKGGGQRYLNPHAQPGHWNAQQYLPEHLRGRVFYHPSTEGREGALREEILRRRETQVAAFQEEIDAQKERLGGRRGAELGDPSTASDPALDRWITRTIGGIGRRLEELRDLLFEWAAIQENDRVLDLDVSGGFLTWEALRRAPLGGVYACASSESIAKRFEKQAQNLNPILRPILLHGGPLQLSELLSQSESSQKSDAIHFEKIIGRNALLTYSTKETPRAALLTHFLQWLSEDGTLTLAENLPQETQRLYQLLPPNALPESLSARLSAAEEQIYRASSGDPMLGWSPEEILDLLEKEGCATRAKKIEQFVDVNIGQELISRWFLPQNNKRICYAEHLSKLLSADEVESVKETFEEHLLGQTVRWRSVIWMLQVAKKK